jgi:hypothetical protein
VRRHTVFIVGSSGLIIAFVVALWAAYFVPLVLRRYDEAGKNSSLDFEGPLRRVINPRRKAVQEEEPVSASVQRANARAAAQARGQVVQRESARIAARRRRNTLLTLVGLLVVVSIVAGFSVVPVWSPAIPVALIAAWLVACRLQVRGELGMSRSRVDTEADADDDLSFDADDDIDEVPTSPSIFAKLSARFARTAASVRGAGHVQVDDNEDTIIVSHQFEDVDPHIAHVMETAELPVEALVEQLEIAVPSMAENGAALWDPLPITLPTYVTKPRAGRTVRTIEFGRSGTWTSGHIEGEQTELPAGVVAHDEDDYGQRAVGH